MHTRQLLTLASFISIAAVVPVAARASGSPELPPAPAAPAPVAPVNTAPAAAPPPINMPVAATPASAPSPGDKSPSFEVRDRGDSVEIIAHNVKASRTAVIPVRQRLEVPIVPGVSAKRTLPADPTVKLVELDSENSIRVLSVKLSLEREDVKTLSRFVQAIQVGDDLHMLVPRKLPADGVAPKLPGPTLPPDLAAAVARIDQASAHAKAEAKPEAKPEAKLDAKPEAKPEAKIDEKAAAAIAAAKQAAPEVHAVAVPVAPKHEPGAGSAAAGKTDPQALNQVLAPSTDDAWSKISMYGALGLAAAGAGVWLMRRRRAQAVPIATIEILAQRSLGGKARILWLSAGAREMMVSVTPQHVRLLTQWRKTDAAAPATAPALARITGPLPASMHGALPAAYADAVPAAYAGTIPPYAAEAIAATSAARGRTSERIERPTSQRIERTTGQYAAQPQRERLGSERPETGTETDKPVSPAVSGILRLRSRTGQMAVPEPVATNDLQADEDWAKELLAATGVHQ